MNVHLLETTQRLAVTPEKLWVFLSSPENLKKITPPEMKFRITSPPCPSGKISAGQIITYRISVLKFLRVTWVTEISHVDEPRYFVDDQRIGPYAFWHHKHLITPVDGGVEMKDEVYYKLPFGFLGNILLERFIRKQLVKIFSFRFDVMETMFGIIDN